MPLWTEPLPYLHTRAIMQIVSNQWNSIITNTPQLWNQIFLVKSSAGTKTPAWVAAVWIANSRHVPLTIYVQNHFFEFMSTRFLNDHFDLFSTVVSRWEDLTFGLHDTSCVRGLIPILETSPFNKAMSLTSALFDFEKGRGDASDIPTKKAQILRKHFDFSRLTTLSVTAQSIDPVLIALRHASALKCLEIRIPKHGAGFFDTSHVSKTVILPSLEFLSLNVANNNYYFLDLLQAPSLLVLAIGDPAHEKYEGNSLHGALENYFFNATNPPYAIIYSCSISRTSLCPLLEHSIISKLLIFQIIYQETHENMHNWRRILSPDLDNTADEDVDKNDDEDVDDTASTEAVVGTYETIGDDTKARLELVRDARWPGYGFIGWVNREEARVAFESTPSTFISGSLGGPADDHADWWRRAIQANIHILRHRK
ncbi:hypothetical protein NP233_g8951 [Leucocoprinus birnbaumii]|uniref:Uncharacterized protein n=1 Tax=Leucocoprinus birnbaumii TaxID=56174 RepID=A0AAD5VLM9_9AGAR|nr:hypothetical protein NP233_g8951 [Leucocoprinus birnbaumii]